MSDQELMVVEQQQGVRSGVRIEMNAKGAAQVKVSVYEGTTIEEMQAVKDLAMQTYLATVRELSASVVLAGA